MWHCTVSRQVDRKKRAHEDKLNNHAQEEKWVNAKDRRRKKMEPAGQLKCFFAQRSRATAQSKRT